MRKFLIMILLVAVCFMVGCQTLKGGLNDGAWLLQKGADNIAPPKANE